MNVYRIIAVLKKYPGNDLGLANQQGNQFDDDISHMYMYSVTSTQYFSLLFSVYFSEIDIEKLSYKR